MFFYKFSYISIFCYENIVSFDEASRKGLVQPTHPNDIHKVSY